MTLALAVPHAADSPLTRLDARWKLAALGIAAVAVAALRTLPAAAVGLAVSAGLVAVSRLPRPWLRRRLGELALAVGPLVVLLPLFEGMDGLRLAALLAAKAVAIAGLTAVVLGTAPLPVNLHAAHALRVPGAFVQVALLSYRAAARLADEFGRLWRSVRLRGFAGHSIGHGYRTIGTLMGSMVVRGQRRAEDVALAMRCRGFDGRFRSAAAFRTRPADVLFAAATILTGAALVAWDVS